MRESGCDPGCGTAIRKGRQQICSILKPPRHISTLHERAMPASHLVSPQFEAKRLRAGRSQMVFHQRSVT